MVSYVIVTDISTEDKVVNTASLMGPRSLTSNDCNSTLGWSKHMLFASAREEAGLINAYFT